MEMRASQVIKGALGGGAKRKKRKKKRLGEKRREGGREDTFKSTPVVRCGELECHSYLGTALKQVSDTAYLTSSGTKVIVTFATFCRFSSRNHN